MHNVVLNQIVFYIIDFSINHPFNFACYKKLLDLNPN